jgi:hypothetical protein
MKNSVQDQLKILPLIKKKFFTTPQLLWGFFLRRIAMQNGYGPSEKSGKMLAADFSDSNQF